MAYHTLSLFFAVYRHCICVQDVPPCMYPILREQTSNGITLDIWLMHCSNIIIFYPRHVCLVVLVIWLAWRLPLATSLSVFSPLPMRLHYGPILVYRIPSSKVLIFQLDVKFVSQCIRVLIVLVITVYELRALPTLPQPYDPLALRSAATFALSTVSVFLVLLYALPPYQVPIAGYKILLSDFAELLDYVVSNGIAVPSYKILYESEFASVIQKAVILICISSS